MPKFYVAKATYNGENHVIAKGSMEAIKIAIRADGTRCSWTVEEYDFSFTKDTVCALIEGTMKPAITNWFHLDDSGRVRQGLRVTVDSDDLDERNGEPKDVEI